MSNLVFEAIGEDQIQAADEVDRFFREQGVTDVPSFGNTLRLIKGIKPEEFERVAQEAWGTGAQLAPTSLAAHASACVDKIYDAATAASGGWAGEARDAFAERLGRIRQGLDDIQPPVANLAESLEELARVWNTDGLSLVNNILSIIGVILGLIGLLIELGAVAAAASGAGALLAPALAVVGLIIGVAGLALTWLSTTNDQRSAVGEATDAAGALLTATGSSPSPSVEPSPAPGPVPTEPTPTEPTPTEPTPTASAPSTDTSHQPATEPQPSAGPAPTPR